MLFVRMFSHMFSLRSLRLNLAFSALKIRSAERPQRTNGWTREIDVICLTFRNKFMTKHYISNLCHRLNFLSERFTDAAVAQNSKYRFLKLAKRCENMPITLLEMVTYTFRSPPERDRNAAGTRNELLFYFEASDVS